MSKAQKRIAALEAERGRILADIDMLTGQLDEAETTLQTAQAAEVRTGAPVADSAVKACDTLTRKISGSRAAVRAVEADLAKARQDLQDAQEAARQDRLSAIHNEAERHAITAERALAELLNAERELNALWVESRDILTASANQAHDLAALTLLQAYPVGAFRKPSQAIENRRRVMLGGIAPFGTDRPQSMRAALFENTDTVTITKHDKPPINQGVPLALPVFDK